MRYKFQPFRFPRVEVLPTQRELAQRGAAALALGHAIKLSVLVGLLVLLVTLSKLASPPQRSGAEPRAVRPEPSAPSAPTSVDASRTDRAARDLAAIRSQLFRYRRALAQDGRPFDPASVRWAHLIEGPPGWEREWTPLMDLPPTDPWGRPYILRFEPDREPRLPIALSLGADGQPGGQGVDADIDSVPRRR